MLVRDLDVRTRLSLSFAAAVAFTIFACAVAITSLSKLREDVDAIGSRELPTITAAYELAQQSEATVASAPGLVVASAQGQRQTAYYRIRDQLARLNEIIGRIRGLDPGAGQFLDRVDREQVQLAATFESLNDAVESRIRHHRLRLDIMSGLVDLRHDLHHEMMDADGSVHPGSTVATAGVEAPRAVNRAATLAMDHLVAAATATRSFDIDDARTGFEQSLTAARAAAVELPSVRAEPVAALLARIEAAGDQRQGLFLARSRELQATDSVEGLLSVYSHLSARLVFATDELIIHKQSVVGRAQADIRAVVQTRTVLLSGLSGLCILGALLIALDVSQNIVQRLFHLHGAMIAAAAGKAVSIDARGRDEISRMAQALEVFIASRTRAEAALRSAKEEADQANQAKTRFLASASHDLRQPLQALGLFSTALTELPLTAEAQAIAGRIDLSIGVLRDLFDALLDISKLEAGVIVPHKLAFDVGGLIGRLVTEFEPQATARGLRLIARPCRVAVVSDPGLLDRMLRNLIANAIRYTERGGILIGCRRRSGGRLAIEVWDTGVGIPADQLTEIFREFHQVRPGAGTGAGLGLGLAIVDRTGRLIDHPVRVRSRLGRGSVFAIDVERAAVLPPPDARSDARPEGTPGAGGRTAAGDSPGNGPVGAGHVVVVIDDDTSIRDGLRLLLGHWGCRVVAAASADDAIGQLSAAELMPDLILADYRLANGETGDNAIAALRAAVDEAVPAVIITGEPGVETNVATTDGPVPVLRKPLAPDRLRTIVREALAGCRRSQGRSAGD